MPFCRTSQTGGAEQYKINARASVRKLLFACALCRVLSMRQQVTHNCRENAVASRLQKAGLCRQLTATYRGSILLFNGSEKLDHPANSIGKHLRCHHFAMTS
jgi:hypothetical protein